MILRFGAQVSETAQYESQVMEEKWIQLKVDEMSATSVIHQIWMSSKQPYVWEVSRG